METPNDWILQEMHINRGWNSEGTYSGNVKFKNGVKMEFALLLDNAKCEKMIAILRDELVTSAAKLGDMMIKSMPIALPESKTNAENS